MVQLGLALVRTQVTQNWRFSSFGSTWFGLVIFGSTWFGSSQDPGNSKLEEFPVLVQLGLALVKFGSTWFASSQFWFNLVWL